MNTKIFFPTFLTLVVLMSSAFTVPTEAVKKLNADLSKSVITWKGYKVTGQHEGTINLKSGALEMTDGALTGGAFEIDMTTIKTTDLSGEYAQKLEGHLKSDDFFGVAKYPTARFEMTKAISRGTPGDYKVIGNLTIKETTKEIKFMVNIDESGAQPTATANITVDRSDFNVRYGSGSFFDNLGDKTIYDEFDLEVKLVVKGA